MLTVLMLSTMLSGAVNIAQDKPRDIVVIGRRISDAQSELQACLARKCPANEDIDATLKLAETHLAAGKYHAARNTLHASIRRNKDAHHTHAIPLSNLYRASGRVASHLGLGSEYYDHTWNIYRTLKSGLPNGSSRQLFARMEIADMMGRTRGHYRARQYYAAIARDAREQGRPDIEATATLRAYLDHWPAGKARDAAIRRIANATDPNVRTAALDAKLALTRMAYERGDVASAESLRRGLAGFDLKDPVLIYAPPFETAQAELTSASDFRMPAPASVDGIAAIKQFPSARHSSTKRLVSNFDDLWVDISFNITPLGDVKDVQLTKSNGDIFWTKPLLASIRGRRYTPIEEPSEDINRVERYTYTSFYEAQTGTRMAGRSPQGLIEFLDLQPGGLAAQ